MTQRDDPELLSNCRDILKRYWFTVSHKGSKNAVTRFYTLFIAERITALEYILQTIPGEKNTVFQKYKKIIKMIVYIIIESGGKNEEKSYSTCLKVKPISPRHL